MKNKIAIVIIFALLISSASYFICHDPSIHSATYKDLLAIEDIGTVLSERIVSYLDNNPNAEVGDLIEVKGIGEKRLKRIKQTYD